jgi:hypothetical protein
VILARFRWLEAELAEALGRRREAETALHAFFASLQLAWLYAQYGRSQEVREILEEVMPLGEIVAFLKDVFAAHILYAQAFG